MLNLCACGCGENVDGTWVVGHWNTGKKQTKETVAKRAISTSRTRRKNGGREYLPSPYVPGVEVVYYNKHRGGRWYGRRYAAGSVYHARLVWEFHFGDVPEGYHVHHKNGRADRLEDDAPENLMLLPAEWNFRVFPHLAAWFGIPESRVTELYLLILPTDDMKLLFRQLCRIILDEVEGTS